MNKNNDVNQMLDLAGQTLKNSQRIMKEKIEILEKQASQKQYNKYKMNTSIDHSTNTSDDNIFVFILSHQLKKELNSYVSSSLNKQCYLIQEKAILAVRIQPA